jgi:hypothetical protein
LPIGYWKDYFSYNSASYIAEINDKVYCVASGGLFFFQKSDYTINRLSKVTGLSDVGVEKLAHCYELDVTIVTYENCNIDLFKNNEVINISDIKRKEVVGLKSIQNITIKNNIAYLSSSLGLILVDLINNEIKDVYNVSSQNENATINGCDFLGDSIIVATNNGLYFSSISGPNLSDFNNWTPYNDSYKNYDNIIVSNGTLFVDTSAQVVSISLEKNNIIQAFADSILINTTNYIVHPMFENVKYALMDDNDNIWVADSINGLLKFSNYEYQESFTPVSSKENRLFSLEFINEQLYVCHGGHINFGTFWNKNGASVKDRYDGWRNYDYYELENARDIVAVAGNGNYTYFASHYNGVVELINNEVVERYSWWNTNNALDTVSYWQDDNRMAIADLKFDNNGNMWGLLSSVERPLFVKTNNNEWYSFSISSSQKFLFDEILIDNYNQKWGIMGRQNGMFVYNDNNTIANLNDDQYMLINTSVGNGNLPSMDVYCFANDLNGEIWVGTNKGVAVFYNPEAVFSGYNFDSQQILISEGDYGQYLLNDEKVKCIAVDGANRKWIGTEKSGAFLLSEDGQKKILHFTKDNSPLFSNNIIDITINHENGEVFIGTEKGLISYRSDATKGVFSQGSCRIFPNPVSENYTGPISISDLVTNANVKITDVGGNLVFETTANGGAAIWSGKNSAGERAASGIYLVLSTDLYGEEVVVGKILFIH